MDFDNESYGSSSEIEADESVGLTSLPEKSINKYKSAYNLFLDWQRLKKENSFSENVLLNYFVELSRTYKASSLWTHYSMLKSILNMNHNINIASYSKLQSFLKRKSNKFVAKKTKTFSPKEIEKFINEAPDDIYLVTKVALILGVMGSCRKNELYAMKFEELTDLGFALVVDVPNSSAATSRTFTISDKFYEICKKYINLRPRNGRCPSFFLHYRKGRCLDQNIGINKFSSMGQQIANFLKLPDPQLYTGHTFRRSSANFLLKTNTNMVASKRHGETHSYNGKKNSNMNEFSSHNLKRKFTESHIAIVNAAGLADESPMSEDENTEVILSEDPKNPLQIEESIIKIELVDGVAEYLKPSEPSQTEQQLITSTSEAEAIESNLLEPTLVNVHALLINILKRVEVMEKNLNKTNALLEKVSKNIVINDKDKKDLIFKHYNFPLEKDSDVEEFNKLLSNSKTVLQDFKNYIQYLMRSAHPNNLPQVFSKIITDEALLTFNWKGTQNKRSFVGSTALCNAIYDSIKCNDFGFSEYENVMKTIIKMSHGRIHSLNFRKRGKDKY